jgi:IclR family acetate operon transcriptional repressor
MSDDRTESSARVADVLLQFMGASDTLGVSAIARELGLSKAVVHRILRTLVDRGMLDIEPATRAYRLGPGVAALGARALRDTHLRPAALPVLRHLQKQTGETTTISARVGDGRVYLDQVVSAKEIKMTVELGRLFPLHAGSSGRAILAFLPQEDQHRVVDRPLDALTPETIVDSETLRARLAEVRETGIAESGGERQVGAASMAAPVFDVDGHPVGALSVCGPVSRFTDGVREQFAPLVVQSADEVSRALGWHGGLPT